LPPGSIVSWTRLAATKASAFDNVWNLGEGYNTEQTGLENSMAAVMIYQNRFIQTISTGIKARAEWAGLHAICCGPSFP
jgi:hypothetical protein